ncbi:hypothetical protein [Cardinium endosymbiont of Bemisia tabaci]|uniref:hypothetical protein n=2 Tax=Cardinium endosymbiont of Bemisia tabaci TaxID=672794 RepID=UPI0010307BC3|nr:hypothetical protein [Cardinium endosymbiont of Bemisia tabaci]
MSTKIYPKCFSLVLKIYIAFFFAMSGCSIECNRDYMKVLANPSYSRNTRASPYSRNRICNSTSIDSYSILPELEKEVKKVVSDYKIYKKDPKYFQDFSRKLLRYESILDDQFGYIHMYECLNSLNSKSFSERFKDLIPKLDENFIKELKKKLCLFYEKIEECKKLINSQSIEFNCLSEKVDMQRQDISEKIKIKYDKELRLIDLYAKDLRNKELSYNDKVNELVNKLQEFRNQEQINQIILINKKEYLQSELNNLTKEINNLTKEIDNIYKCGSKLLIETTEMIKKFRENIVNDKEYFNDAILKTCRIEENIEKKIEIIEENIKKISCSGELIQLNELSNGIKYILSNLDLSIGRKVFSIALRYRSLLLAEQVIETYNSCSYNDFLPDLAHNILYDKKNNAMHDLRVNWTIFKRLLYKNKINIDIDTQLDGECSNVKAMLNMFFEKDDMDSASKLIAYSTVKFNETTYPNLIKLLNHSPAYCLITLFQRLMEANNYFDENYTKHVNNFLNHIGKSERCACTIKKSNYIPISTFDTPPPSPPPEPDKPSPMCVSCAYDKAKAKALCEKHNDSANYNINSNTSLSKFPMSRGKFTISEDDY